MSKLSGVMQSVMLIILTCWVGAWILILLIISWRHAVDLAMHVATTEGTITELHPELHNSFIYQFELANRFYKGRGNGASEVSDLNRTRVVYYDVRDPSISSLEDPAIVSKSILTAIERLILFCVVSSSCLFLKIAVQKWVIPSFFGK